MKGRLVSLLSVLISLPAFAQSETGTRLGGRPAQVPARGTMSDTARARIWLENYAACLVKRDYKRVTRVLDLPIGADNNGWRDLSQGNFDSCLSSGGDASELRMSSMLLRGALYTDRVRHLVGNMSGETIAARPLPIPRDGDSRKLTAIRFGDCVMRRDPGAALSFVRAKATTGIEDKTLAALKPALATCVDSGQAVTLTRSGVKAAVAEVIYRTLRAPAAAANTDGG